MTEYPSYPREASQREAESRPQLPAHEYASWGSRVGALLLDGLIIVVPLVVVLALVFATGADDNDAALAALGLVYLVTLALPFVYFTVLHGGERGATFGKRALGIRVVTEEGLPLGFGRSFGRYGIQFLFGIVVVPLLADYLWPLWDAKNQALHDKVVGSVVVRA